MIISTFVENVLFLNYVNAVGLQSFLDLIDEMTERVTIQVLRIGKKEETCFCVMPAVRT